MLHLARTSSFLGALALAPLAAAQASWHLLAGSDANGVNGDGSVVSAVVHTGAGDRPSRWTVQGGHEVLGGPPGVTGFLGWGNAVSEDGEAVVGEYLITSSPSLAAPGFHYTRATGVTLIPPLLAGDRGSRVEATNADGSVAVGSSGDALTTPGIGIPGTWKAYRWTAATGPVFLGFLSGGLYSHANGVSADGSVVVGTSHTGSSIEAYRWTSAGGMVGLGTLPGSSSSHATDVSSDGRVIVGSSGGQAYRWTAGAGMQALGPGEAVAVNSDGTVIVGRDWSGPDWLWTSAQGRVALYPHLAARGARLPTTGSLYTMDLSANGNAIVGAWYPGNQADYEGWIAYLAPPPFDLCPLLAPDSFEPNNDCSGVSLNPGVHTGLNVQASDPDFYSIDLDVGSTLTVTADFVHVNGDIDLYLHSPLSCSAPWNTPPYTSATSPTDDELLQWQNPSALPRTVILEVRIAAGSPDDCNEYDLTIVTGPGTALGTSYCGPPIVNATGQPGAMLVSGSAAVTANNVTLAAYQLSPGITGYFLASRNQGFVAMPGVSIGNLCLGSPIGRFDALAQGSGGAGQIVRTIDLTALPSPAGPQSAQPGETWNFQCWYRDTLVGLPTSNFTDAVSVTFQ